MTFSEFTTTITTKFTEAQTKQVEAYTKKLVKHIVDNLAGYSSLFSAKLNKTTLEAMCKGEYEAPEDDEAKPKGKKSPKAKKAKKEEESEDDASEVESEDEDASEDAAEEEELPKGITKAKREKLNELYEDLEDGKFINVKTGKVVGKPGKDSYVKGKFIGPKDLEEAIDWCASELGSEDDEDDASDDAASEGEDVSEDAQEDEVSPGYTKKKFESLKKLLKKCPKGKYIHSGTNHQMEKTEKNKGKYKWDDKLKICVPIENPTLFKFLVKQLSK